MFARTGRLMLRPGWPEDANALYEAAAQRDVVRNLRDLPWPYRLDDARQFLTQDRDALYPNMLLFRRTAGSPRLIGSCGLSHGEHGGELGYWIAPAHWGLGYASEAASAVVDIARSLGHTRLHAVHFVDNPASGRVLEKVGFVPTGRIRRLTSAARSESSDGREMVLDLDRRRFANDVHHTAAMHLPYDAHFLAA